MRRQLLGLTAIALATGVFMGLLAVSGCDEGTGRSLTVEPGSVTLRGTTNAVTFTVTTNSLRDLSLPITWKVTSPALGSVVASEGATAHYGRTPQKGINVVTARDQYGAEGFATVSQE